MSDEDPVSSDEDSSRREARRAEFDKYATMRHSFENVYIAYEAEEPLDKDAGDIEFATIFKDDEEFKGEWVVAKSPEATFMFAGYPANTYRCRAERIGYLKFQTASTGITNVFGGDSKIIIEVETGVELDDLQIGHWLYPEYAGWTRIEEWRRFGPNGKQVARLVDWVRREIEDEARLKEIQAIHAHSRSRAKLYWPTAPYVDYPRRVQMPKTSVSWQFWRRGGALSNAWNQAIVAAAESHMWWPCRYLSPGGPWFVAVALRHVLSPQDFRELYADFEQIYPIEKLDRDAPPGEYTIGKVRLKEQGSPGKALFWTGALCLAAGLFCGRLWEAHDAEIARNAIPSYYKDMGAAVKDRVNAILARNAEAQNLVSQHPDWKFYIAPDVLVNYADQGWYCPDDATVWFNGTSKDSDVLESHVNARTGLVAPFQSLDAQTKALEAKISHDVSVANTSADRDDKVDSCLDGATPLKYDTSRGAAESEADND